MAKDELQEIYEKMCAKKKKCKCDKECKCDCKDVKEEIETITEEGEQEINIPKEIYAIAKLIKRDWAKQGKGVNYAAKPYLDAMGEMSSVNDKVGADNGKYIIQYFLGNASAWKGPVAKAVKAHLRKIAK